MRGVFQPTVTYFLVIHIVPYTKVSKEGTDQLCPSFVGLNDFFKNVLIPSLLNFVPRCWLFHTYI